jgi:hypothetical protein
MGMEVLTWQVIAWNRGGPAVSVIVTQERMSPEVEYAVECGGYGSFGRIRVYVVGASICCRV